MGSVRYAARADAMENRLGVDNSGALLGAELSGRVVGYEIVS